MGGRSDICEYGLMGRAEWELGHGPVTDIQWDMVYSNYAHICRHEAIWPVGSFQNGSVLFEGNGPLPVVYPDLRKPESCSDGALFVVGGENAGEACGERLGLGRVISTPVDPSPAVPPVMVPVPLPESGVLMLVCLAALVVRKLWTRVS